MGRLRFLRLSPFTMIVLCGALAGCTRPADGGGTGDLGGGGDDGSVAGDSDGGGSGEDLSSGLCGNGQIDPGETCDDTNSTPGDGCSSSCQVENGWQCPTVGVACTRQVYCGDGYVDAPETCDDGNSTPGDGCSGTCQLEPNYDCAVPSPPPSPVHQVCVSTIVCGNGKVDPGEACDTGDTTGLNGCAADCSTVTPGFTCPPTGGACVAASANCGNAMIDPGEDCDDGNTDANDGCTDTCQRQAGYTCPTAGQKCTLIKYCGDSTVTAPENCDDGNATSGDGCSATCQREPDYTCPATGGKCTSTVKCGDGVLAGAEKCDDGNLKAGDGCDASCNLETGWQCPAQGQRCIAKKCGDGVVAGTEQCDDGADANGNPKSGDGCSATCTIETGWTCATATMTSVCHKTVCGDGKVEGAEQCDDSNRVPFDGCSPTCTKEPNCKGGQCTGVCGDGLKFPQEECDDGNTAAGDGCSATCKIEAGFTCTAVNEAPASQLVLPILYRDMRYYDKTNGHPDFNVDNYSSNTGKYPGGVATGLVNTALGTDGEPVFRTRGTNASWPVLTGATEFCWWFHDKGCDTAHPNDPNPYSKLVALDKNGNPTTLTLASIGTNQYQYTTDAFFPVDGLGWNVAGGGETDFKCDTTTNAHNFAFTSELHYAFTYKASGSTTTTGPTFTFVGDDDVWAYINGKQIADLGGVHGPQTASYVLTSNAKDTSGAALGLADGGFYSIDVFQAERHTCGSNYTLTLSDFTHTRSSCKPVCGDGQLEGNEVCDDGVNDGTYGHCLAGCGGRAGYCGDKIKQTQEECDDGVNLTTYGGLTAGQCAPGCKLAPYCGDQVVSNGEECDDGPTGSANCSSTCTLPARCGDGAVQGAEECDDGANNGVAGDKCSAACKLLCGNGTLDPGEACDKGAANNVGGYGGCNKNCTLAARCGDAIKNGSEQCDNGTNSGAYGTCNADCTLAPYCGDGVKNGTEQCDNGSQNSQNAYGQGKCTTTCQTAPYCGDGIVESSFGEECDGGNSCTPTCTRQIL